MIRKNDFMILFPLSRYSSIPSFFWICISLSLSSTFYRSTVFPFLYSLSRSFVPSFLRSFVPPFLHSSVLYFLSRSFVPLFLRSSVLLFHRFFVSPFSILCLVLPFFRPSRRSSVLSFFCSTVFPFLRSFIPLYFPFLTFLSLTLCFFSQ